MVRRPSRSYLLALGCCTSVELTCSMQMKRLMLYIIFSLSLLFYWVDECDRAHQSLNQLMLKNKNKAKHTLVLMDTVTSAQ